MNDRKHLVSAEVKKLIVATKESRNEICDKCLLSLMSRHGLRSHSTICGAPKIKLAIECGYVPGLLRFFRRCGLADTVLLEAGIMPAEKVSEKLPSSATEKLTDKVEPG
jgi:hypothetical protein